MYRRRMSMAMAPLNLSSRANNLTVGRGGAPRTASPAVVANLGRSDEKSKDWRVGLSVPSALGSGNDIFAPFSNTGNRMIFPLNPTIVLGHSATYSNISPTHSNYVFHTYQSSQVDNIQIIGEFYVQNEDDAKYWIAATHFLKTMTKMFYGSGSHLGKPPLLTRLNGYGKHVLNNIPVLITQMTVDLPKDVDYISCVINGEENFVPTESQVSVSCAPNYSRRSVSTFNLQDFARGAMVGKSQGFA
jgi:hypothetical protein